MKEDLTEKFLDYIEGSLDQGESERLRAALASDESLRREFERYQRVVALEGELRRITKPSQISVVSEVMAQLPKRRRTFFIPLSAGISIAAIALVLTSVVREPVLPHSSVPSSVSAPTKIVDLSKEEQLAQAELLGRDGIEVAALPAESFSVISLREASANELSRSLAQDPFTLPAGYKAVTVPVPNTSSVEGFARPHSRVNVLFSYREQEAGQLAVYTAAKHAKVLSVGGMVAVGGDELDPHRFTPVTLLLNRTDAETIEIAKKVGTLSLQFANGNGATSH